MSKQRKVAVIGGGAAGLMAAVTAAKNGAQVTIFERNEKIGKKILATGNGKCNFSNEDLSVNHYAGSLKDKFQSVYEQFPRESLKKYFMENGMLIRDKKGYLYPNTEQAATVVDFFLEQTKIYGIKTITDCCIRPKDIIQTKNGFQITIRQNKKEVFDSVILTTGGVAAPKTGSDGIGFDIAKQFGHKIIPVIPSLVQLYTNDENAKALAGVRADADIELLVDNKPVCEEYGELQLTNYGVSGIPIFQLSRYAGYALREHKKVQVVIDFLREYQEEALVEQLKKQWKNYQSLQALQKITKESFFHGFINKKITMVILKKCNMKPTDTIENLTEKDMVRFVQFCKAYVCEITKTNSFEQAQVSAGGIPSNEVNEDLSSKFVKGLYFAGEILDLDGRCGGYNLQWAFSSGYCAGMHASGIL